MNSYRQRVQKMKRLTKMANRLRNMRVACAFGKCLQRQTKGNFCFTPLNRGERASVIFTRLEKAEIWLDNAFNGLLHEYGLQGLELKGGCFGMR